MSQRLKRAGRGGGRPRKRNDARNERTSRRYWVARGLGLNAYDARAASGNVDSFISMLLAHGKSTADYGELCVRLVGGHPRTSPERGIRYRALRAYGLSAADCSALSDKPGVFARAIRRLKLGLTP